VADFTFILTAGFVTLFANNEQADKCLDTITSQLGARMTENQWRNTRKQLRAAGYTARKSKPITKKHLNDILQKDPLGLLG